MSLKPACVQVGVQTLQAIPGKHVGQGPEWTQLVVKQLAWTNCTCYRISHLKHLYAASSPQTPNFAHPFHPNKQNGLKPALLHPNKQTGLEPALLHPNKQNGLKPALLHPIKQNGLKPALPHPIK